ncbi:hypothetical protein LshimejAT787_0404470 [Lyophyllum shimeji]|uniref:Uncharacterized protein n=1 Tax=Lyophyllum shimeji TaxID=47721 RepID=A0A9P3PL89_LYOSH|nr:hypothetical protein LshimejAT787_0404470 [Lyophyllum shimeji]
MSPISSTLSLEADVTGSPGPSDLVAIAELFSTLKRTVSTLHATFDRLGTQTEKMACLAPAIKADQQIQDVRARLEDQIRRHERLIDKLRLLLEDAIKETVVEQLKSRIYPMIQESVAKEVQQRVERELETQVPAELREQVQAHQREIIEVQTNLHNSEARRHNASLRSPSMTTEPLRPLLRPLPSALQSPAYILKRPFTASNSLAATPMTAFPGVSLTTPTVLPAASTRLVVPPGSNQMFELVPPTPSPLFPRDLKSLFALGPDAARSLLHDYGLYNPSSAVPSPNTEKPRMRAVPDTGLNTPEDSPTFENCASREQDINKFMAHIGVPYLMVPAPRPRNVPAFVSLSLVQDALPSPVIY